MIIKQFAVDISRIETIDDLSSVMNSVSDRRQKK